MQVPGATVSTSRALIYLSLLSITRRGDGVYTLTHSASLSTRSAGLAQTESKLGGRHQRLKLTQQNKTSDTGLASHRAAVPRRGTQVWALRGVHQQGPGAVCKDSLSPEAEARGTKAAREPSSKRWRLRKVTLSGGGLKGKGHTINVEHREPRRAEHRQGEDKHQPGFKVMVKSNVPRGKKRLV